MSHDTVKDESGWVSLAGFGAASATLTGSHTANWVVVGAGFTGLAAARQIAALDPEASVFLLDRQRAGQGASGRNSGFLVANESLYSSMHPGPDQIKKYHVQNTLDRAGVTELKELVARHDIDCDWHDTGFIHAAADPGNFQRIRNMASAFRDLGLVAELMDGDMLQNRIGTAYYKLGVLNTGGALAQPAKLANGLRECLPSHINVCENTTVVDVESVKGKVRVTLVDGEILADRVIVALNAFMPRLGFANHRVFPLALTASLTRPLNDAEEGALGQPTPWGVLSPRSLGATVRLTPDRRILMRNTAEYRNDGIPPSLLSARRELHADALRKRFPEIAEDAIEYTWSGHICVSYDGNPVFEKVAEGLFAVGGYNASGVSRGSIMGKLIVDYALGNPSELLQTALAINTRRHLPPKPFFDIGVNMRMAYERFRARRES